jgi:hypothetical protein
VEDAAQKVEEQLAALPFWMIRAAGNAGINQVLLKMVGKHRRLILLCGLTGLILTLNPYTTK